VHLVGFIIRIYHDTRSHECQIRSIVNFTSQSLLKGSGVAIIHEESKMTSNNLLDKSTAISQFHSGEGAGYSL
jgi:hypothetical protein